MRGDQPARQWRASRAIEASPYGLIASKIAQREEIGFRKIYRDLEALRMAGLPVHLKSREDQPLLSSTPSNLESSPIFPLSRCPFKSYKDILRIKKALQRHNNVHLSGCPFEILKRYLGPTRKPNGVRKVPEILRTKGCDFIIADV